MEWKCPGCNFWFKARCSDEAPKLLIWSGVVWLRHSWTYSLTRSPTCPYADEPSHGPRLRQSETDPDISPSLSILDSISIALFSHSFMPPEHCGNKRGCSLSAEGNLESPTFIMTIQINFLHVQIIILWTRRANTLCGCRRVCQRLQENKLSRF